jgi:hypothetical protein
MLSLVNQKADDVCDSAKSVAWLPEARQLDNRQTESRTVSRRHLLVFN